MFFEYIQVVRSRRMHSILRHDATFFPAFRHLSAHGAHTRGEYHQAQSGSWRVQVRRKGKYVNETFLRREDAEEWSTRLVVVTPNCPTGHLRRLGWSGAFSCSAALFLTLVSGAYRSHQSGNRYRRNGNRQHEERSCGGEHLFWVLTMLRVLTAHAFRGCFVSGGP